MIMKNKHNYSHYQIMRVIVVLMIFKIWEGDILVKTNIHLSTFTQDSGVEQIPSLPVKVVELFFRDFFKYCTKKLMCKVPIHKEEFFMKYYTLGDNSRNLSKSLLKNW